MYNKNEKAIVAKKCGQLGADSKEKLKYNISESCKRKVNYEEGNYITNDRDYQPLSSAFGKPQSEPAPWTPDRRPIKTNRLPNYNKPDCSNISQEQCDVRSQQAHDEWKKKELLMEEIKKSNPERYKEWKKSKPTECSIFKEISGIPCDCCNNCIWDNDNNICV